VTRGYQLRELPREERKREQFVDLLRRVLALDSGARITVSEALDSGARITATEALEHPFVMEPL
jgi:hypothetical protein